MQTIRVKNNPRAVAQHAMYIAWNSASVVGPHAVLHRKTKATKQEVLAWTSMKGDELFADYVFGRMMKLRLSWNEETQEIFFDDNPPNMAYQSWALTYPTYERLIEAADEILCVPSVAATY